MTRTHTLPPHLREAMLLARLRMLGSDFSAGEAARMLGYDREFMARQCHRFTKAGKLERIHHGEAVICRYRLTEAGHACADQIAPSDKPSSDADKVLATLSHVAFVNHRTIRAQTRLPASVIDQELDGLLSARRVQRRLDQREFWYRRLA